VSRRKLTEGCRFALRSIAEHGGVLDIYNRTVAGNLRVVEKVFPELIIITPPPACSHVGARPLFGVRLTERGLAFITPRKIAMRNRAHASEAAHAV
jgi:hypothetical protein